MACFEVAMATFLFVYFPFNNCGKSGKTILRALMGIQVALDPFKYVAILYTTSEGNLMWQSRLKSIN